MTEISFSKATIADAEQLVSLINSAYRGDASRQGWTTEADLLAGVRTELSEVLRLMADEQALFVLCKSGDSLVGSMLLERSSDQVHFGMLAVDPSKQGQGIGKQLLAYAEAVAVETWQLKRFVMSVISVRHELIAYYQRRGYQRTGTSYPFPENPALWQLKVPALQLETLEKVV